MFKHLLQLIKQNYQLTESRAHIRHIADVEIYLNPLG